MHASVTSPAIGQLPWSEEFNGPSLDASRWTAMDGNVCQINLCGYGNQELEYYSPNNVSIADVPFEPGTRALAIRAQNQTVGSNVFTSGKIDSHGKVQVQYGMIEIRMATPNIATGLWPASWMLGTSPQTWPRNGEIDIMEQLDGKGAVKLGNQTVPEVAGKFGVFTDNTPPYEAANVIAWSYTAPGQWFGGGVQARQARDLTNYPTAR
jgi:beta-glucanase (GH16 family)